MRTLAVSTAVLTVASAVMTRGDAGRSDPGSLVQAFACIHRFEGAWDSDTGNGYYGGLQMDADFERKYGREFLAAFGHASNWPPALQIAVAIRAYLSGRGFGPWPNTARLCGLMP